MAPINKLQCGARLDERIANETDVDECNLNTYII